MLQRENVFLQHEQKKSTKEVEVLERLLEEYERDCQAIYTS